MSLTTEPPFQGSVARETSVRLGTRPLLAAIDEHPRCDNHQRANNVDRVAEEQIKNHADSSEQRSVARLVAAII